VHWPRQKQTGHRSGTSCAGQEVHSITLALGLYRSTLFLPVRDQLIEARGLEYIAGQDVRPYFRAFLDNDYGQALIELHQAYGRGQACRSTTHDYDVEFHRLAFKFL
jgi:hypothetical protein